MVQLMRKATGKWNVSELVNGEKYSLEGLLVCHDSRCWLVPSTGQATMDQRKEGVLFRIPGLASSILENTQTRVTSGRPMATVLVKAVGVVERSNIEPFALQFSEVDELTILGESGSTEELDLNSVGDLSALEIERINAYTSPDYRSMMAGKFRLERAKW